MPGRALLPARTSWLCPEQRKLSELAHDKKLGVLSYSPSGTVVALPRMALEVSVGKSLITDLPPPSTF